MSLVARSGVAAETTRLHCVCVCVRREHTDTYTRGSAPPTRVNYVIGHSRAAATLDYIIYTLSLSVLPSLAHSLVQSQFSIAALQEASARARTGAAQRAFLHTRTHTVVVVLVVVESTPSHKHTAAKTPQSFLFCSPFVSPHAHALVCNVRPESSLSHSFESDSTLRGREEV